jgi:predicted nucleic acid-binding protein
VLLEAKRKGLIEQVMPNVNRLISELRFFVSPPVLERLAQLASE